MTYKDIIMLKKVIILMMAACATMLLSCQKEDPVGPTIVFNSNRNMYVVEEATTPISAVIYVDKYNYGETNVFVSEKKDSLEYLMNHFNPYVDVYNHYLPSGLSTFSRDLRKRYIIVEDLNPATTYYYFVSTIYDDMTIEFTPIHSFETEHLPLAVDMGGSVKWCSVNFDEDRKEFKSSQMFYASLFWYNELPSAESEILEGDWRYPTRKELEYLCDNCSVTLIDLKKEWLRLTSKNGNNLYIPFTFEESNDKYKNGPWKLMLFPDKSRGGLYVKASNKSLYSIKNLLDSDYHIPILFSSYYDSYGKFTEECELQLTSDLFTWTYLDEEVTPPQTKRGDSRRGVRFVLDK